MFGTRALADDKSVFFLRFISNFVGRRPCSVGKTPSI